MPQATASSLPRKGAEQAGFLRKIPPSPRKLLNVGPPGANCGGGRLGENDSGAGEGGWDHHSRTRTLGARGRPRRRKAGRRRACVRSCVSPRPAVTARGSPAHEASPCCQGCGRSAAPQGPPLEKGPGAPAPARLCPSCPGAWKSARERKKGAALGRAVRPAAEHREAAIAAAAPRRVPAAQGASWPPLLRNFFFRARPTRKVRAGRGRGRAGLPAAAGEEEVVPVERGRAEEMPCPPAARPAPPPRGHFGGPSPAGSGGGGGGRCGPAARRSQQCGAGKTKGSTLPPSPALVSAPGRRAGSTASGGRSPGGPWPRAPRFPRGTPLSPPPPRQREAPRARTPGPGGSGHIVPAARGALGLGRGQSPCAHPPASGSKSRGRLGNCRRDAAAATASGRRHARGFAFFFFFANPDGKEGDRLLRIHQLSSQQKSWRKRRPAGATSSAGGAASRHPPGWRPPPGPSRDTGPGAQTKDVLGCRLRVLRPPSPPRVAQ